MLTLKSNDPVHHVEETVHCEGLLDHRVTNRLPVKMLEGVAFLPLKPSKTSETTGLEYRVQFCVNIGKERFQFEI